MCNFCSYKERDKQQFVDTFKVIFDKAKIDKPGLFYNFYAFLLFEVYDQVQHKGVFISQFIQKWGIPPKKYVYCVVCAKRNHYIFFLILIAYLPKLSNINFL